MNLYFDTSFLAPLILQEATSAAVEEFIATLLPEQLCISQWTRVEFASLVAREVRMGSFRRDEALTAIVQFDDMVLRFWRVLVPTSGDYELAKNYVQRVETKSRAGGCLAPGHRSQPSKCPLHSGRGIAESGRVGKGSCLTRYRVVISPQKSQGVWVVRAGKPYHRFSPLLRKPWPGPGLDP